MIAEERLFNSINESAKSAIDIKENKIGKVKSVNPLIITIGALELDKEDLLVNYTLLNHTLVYEDDTVHTVEVKSCLHIGDTVILREMTKEKFYVSAKVV